MIHRKAMRNTREGNEKWKMRNDKWKMASAGGRTRRTPDRLCCPHHQAFIELAQNTSRKTHSGTDPYVRVHLRHQTTAKREALKVTLISFTS